MTPQFIGYVLESLPGRYRFYSTEDFARETNADGFRIYEALSQPLDEKAIIGHVYGKPYYLGPMVYEPA